MTQMIVYENLSSGGIATVIAARIEEYQDGDTILYFLNNRGGSGRFENIEGVHLFCGTSGHLHNLIELVRLHQPARMVLFSHYHLHRELGPSVGEIVFEYHNSDENSLMMLANVLPDGARLIVPSEWSKSFVTSVWSGDVEVKPNKISEDVFKPIDVDDVPSRPAFIYVGQLGYHKGSDIILQAMSISTRMGADCELHIVLSSTVRDQDYVGLLRKIEGYGLFDRVSIHSSISQSELARLFSTASASRGANLIASVRESFGLVVLEARACGLATIASSTSALVEVCGDNDVIYPAGEAKALANEILNWCGEERTGGLLRTV